ncbi:hypothetical protein FGO68_gene8286 [Halteria grandinella]|uniref:Uncharacterized protein n=1 Tax=Halteria grandinella TaxID=5974 RepID=A0A8J8T729_HALGN|nr:hypothetical protein FGO68_gene8286 [Halteria grandinella]
MPFLNSLYIQIKEIENSEDCSKEKKKWNQECESAIAQISQILIDRDGFKQIRFCVPKSFLDIDSQFERNCQRYDMTLTFAQLLMKQSENIQNLKLRNFTLSDQLELIKNVVHSKQLKELAFTLPGATISSEVIDKTKAKLQRGYPAYSEEESTFEGRTFETMFLKHLDLVRSLKQLEKVKVENTKCSRSKWDFYALCIPALQALKEIDVSSSDKKGDSRDNASYKGWTDARKLLKAISESNSIQKLYCNIVIPTIEITNFLKAKSYPIYFEDRGKKYGFHEFMELHKATSHMHYLNVKILGMEGPTIGDKKKTVPENVMVQALLAVKQGM